MCPARAATLRGGRRRAPEEPEPAIIDGMTTVVLAISRQLGSGGSYIGQGVAHRLGFKYLDREILHQAAEMLGRKDEDLEQLDERIANGWVRLTRHLSIGPPDALFTPPRPAASVYEEDLFRIERQVMREAASRDNCVIVGRASPIVLRDHPGVIRMFVRAPEAWRVETLMKSMKDRSREEILDLIHRTDRERARFVHAVCGCDWTNACHYDVALNPAKIGLDAAVDIVTEILRKRMRELNG